MALFLFKDFWEEGEVRYLEFTENGIFKVPTARWEGQNLDVALLAILLLRSSLKPLHGKSLEFVLLINGLQKWASWQFLEMFIFAFLVRCPVNRGFEVFLFVSSPILLGERGASHIRVWGLTHSYQLPDAFVSGSRRARIWGGVRWKI